MISALSATKLGSASFCNECFRANNAHFFIMGVRFDMLGPGHYLQILWPVIQLVVVQMMNDFVRTKFSAQHSFSHRSMFKNGVASDSTALTGRCWNYLISIFVNMRAIHPMFSTLAWHRISMSKSGLSYKYATNEL